MFPYYTGQHSVPRSLYIHIPFCVKKCPYCAFPSRPPEEHEPLRYLAALERELTMWETIFGKKLPLSTLYVGGGTPTLLSFKEWVWLEELIDRHCIFEDGTEVTVEANPGSLSSRHLEVWKKWRVSRVSIGVQSFDDAELAGLQRVHNAYEAVDAVCATLSAGFDVSLDLMFGLAFQTLENWARTLAQAVSLNPHHISIYQLTLEPGTPWGENPSDSLASGDDGYAFYRYAQWFLPRKGYGQYEIANFSKPGHECRHNLVYWTGEDYLGIGAGASGYLEGKRYRNEPDVSAYLIDVESRRFPILEWESLPREKAFREAAVLGLRTRRGLQRLDFERRFGSQAWRQLLEEVALQDPSLFQRSSESLSLSSKGMRVANQIWIDLI